MEQLLDRSSGKVNFFKSIIILSLQFAYKVTKISWMNERIWLNISKEDG